MNKFFNYVGGPGAVGLLIVRLVFGIGIAMHGYQKVSGPGGPMGWMGPHAPVPTILQGLAALSEFGGGLAIIMGLLTQLAGLGLMFTMLVATYMVAVQMKAPFIATKPGGMSFEPAVGYLAVALLMIFTGPGSISVDAFIAKAVRKNKS